MSEMMCKFCGSIFELEDISKPMKGSAFGFVWVDDQCPKCKKGFDDWYIPMESRTNLYFRDILPRAIRYQKNV